MRAGLDRAHQSLAAALIDRHPDDAVRLMETAPDADVVALLETESVRRAVAVLKRIGPDRAATVLAGLSDERTRRVLESLDGHRAAALLARLEPETREKNLAVLPEPLADDLRALAQYPSDTAGGQMDTAVTAFRPGATVREVVARLRSLRLKRIQDLFLTDENGHLVGSVPLQDVVLAAPGDTLETIARSPTPSVQATTPRDAVIEELETQRANSLPVVDFDGRLLGVLRQEQLIRTAQREGTAGLLKMVGVSREERALSSPFFVVRKRLPWLQINLLTAFLAAAVVGFFEETIARFTALAVLLPVVAGQSGNTGAQSLAVTMRGLALREIRLRHWMRVAGKELSAGALNGLAVAATTCIGVWFWSGSPGLVVVIGVSMVISMAIAGLAGATIPMILTWLRQDPAQSSSIVLTTITDVAGFLSFLGIATLLAEML